MRWSTLILLALIALLQGQLWLSRSGVFHVREQQVRLDEQTAANEAAKARNERLQAEVRDLREGLEMVEEKARAELGMVKPDEILVQIQDRR
jgi:cell division protein FtsB